jgi:hypothetical protein
VLASAAVLRTAYGAVSSTRWLQLTPLSSKRARTVLPRRAVWHIQSAAGLDAGCDAVPRFSLRPTNLFVMLPISQCACAVRIRRGVASVVVPVPTSHSGAACGAGMYVTIVTIVPKSLAAATTMQRGDAFALVNGAEVTAMRATDLARLLTETVKGVGVWNITLIPANHVLLSNMQVSRGLDLLAMVLLPASGASLALLKSTGCFTDRDKVIEMGYMCVCAAACTGVCMRVARGERRVSGEW